MFFLENNNNNINFIYSVDKTFRLFNRAEPNVTVLNFLTPVPANKMQLFIHGTMPYIHPRNDSRIGSRFSYCCFCVGIFVQLHSDVPSSLCHGMVSDLRSWHFLVILNCFIGSTFVWLHSDVPSSWCHGMV